MNRADQLLIRQVRDGDPASWEQFIARYEGRLLAFVDARLVNRSLSEDIVQETFIGFLTSLPNYDESTPVDSFLFAIAAHKLTDVLRRQGRRPTVPLLTSTDEDGKVSEPVGSARHASSMMRSREDRTAEQTVVARCLAELIEQWLKVGDFERLQCAELLFVLGWPNREAAAVLGISEQAVANHKYFVVSKLKSAARDARLTDVSLPELTSR
ncbi:MAG: RNA polymerase sigma factor [Planctomycetota bacterium]|nr:RNA polymerase sigma factor [Planctomycetota bacterium]